MLVYIKQSIKKECVVKVTNSGEEPFITAANGSHKEEFNDGPLYINILISRTRIDSQSTVTYIKSNLAELG